MPVPVPVPDAEGKDERGSIVTSVSSQLRGDEGPKRQIHYKAVTRGGTRCHGKACRGKEREPAWTTRDNLEEVTRDTRLRQERTAA